MVSETNSNELCVRLPENWNALSHEQRSSFIKEQIPIDRQYEAFSSDDQQQELHIFLTPEWYKNITHHASFQWPTGGSHKSDGSRAYLGLLHAYDNHASLSFIEYHGNEQALERFDTILEHPWHACEFTDDAWKIKWMLNRNPIDEKTVDRIVEQWNRSDQDSQFRLHSTSNNQSQIEQLKQEIVQDLLDKDMSDARMLIFNGQLALLPETLSTRPDEIPTMVTYVLTEDHLLQFMRPWQ